MSILSQYGYIDQTVTDENNDSMHFPNCAKCMTWQQLFAAMQNNEHFIRVDPTITSQMEIILGRLDEIKKQYEGSVMADMGGGIVSALFGNDSFIGSVADSFSYGARNAEWDLENEYNSIVSSEQAQIMNLMFEYYNMQCQLDDGALIMGR